MKLALKALEIQGFRNYKEPIQFTFTAPWFGVHGPNASGKTNLLEAIFFLARRRGFRNQPWTKLKTWGHDYGFIRGEFSGFDREICWRNDRVDYLEDGDAVTSRRDWATKVPIFGYRPDDDLFFHDQPADRRRYLDWLCSYISGTYIELVVAYEQVLKQRNAALRDPRVRDAEFLIWEAELARFGTQLHSMRARAVAELAVTYRQLWQELEREPAEVQYNPGGMADVRQMQQKLVEDRTADRTRGWTNCGPHRDDMVVLRERRPIRESGSQGYRKLGVILLAAACAMAVPDKGLPPLFYLDDIEGELDEDNEDRLFTVLEQLPFQVFLTGVRQPVVLSRRTTQPRIQWQVLPGQESQD